MTPAGLAAGVALALSFALLWQRRLDVLLRSVVLQAVAVAVVALWQGWRFGSASLCLAGLLVLAANGAALPAALRRAGGRLGSAEVGDRVGSAGLALAAALAALAALAVPVLAAPVLAAPVLAAPLPAGAARQVLAVAVAVVLLGALMMVRRPGVLAQAIGFAAMADGVLLAVAAVPGPVIAVLPVAALVLPAAMLPGFLPADGDAGR